MPASISSWAAFPPRQSVYADPALAEKYKFVPALVESWKEGVPEFRPRFAEWPAITEIVQEWGTKMMLGEVSVEDGAKTIGDKIRPLPPPPICEGEGCVPPTQYPPTRPRPGNSDLPGPRRPEAQEAQAAKEEAQEAQAQGQGQKAQASGPEGEGGTMRGRKALPSALLSALALVALAAPAVAAAATEEPAWNLQAFAAPTNFTPADPDGIALYEVMLTNAGAKASDGERSRSPTPCRPGWGSKTWK